MVAFVPSAASQIGSNRLRTHPAVDGRTTRLARTVRRRNLCVVALTLYPLPISRIEGLIVAAISLGVMFAALAARRALLNLLTRLTAAVEKQRRETELMLSMELKAAAQEKEDEETIRRIRKEMTMLEEQNAAANEEYKKCTEKISSFRQQITEVETRLTEVQKTVLLDEDQLKAEKIRLNEALRTSENEAQSMRKGLKNIQNEIGALKAETTKLRHERDSLHQAVRSQTILTSNRDGDEDIRNTLRRNV
mmetsp:Transcript_4933/g.14846  ORF Transcript_4933/g.14846 Transcript_4933/m.14846 type:complete len:250 (+) Transcript_4933:990-1739(+)